MINDPLVTIVTPTYNREDLLVDTIQSVLNQTYTNIEYIIVNDGSTDNTSEILKKYSHVATVINKDNSGQVDSINLGWKMAEGEIITYLSDDDLLLPNAIEELVKVMQTTNAVCVYPDSNLIGINDEIIKKSVCKKTIYKDLLIKQDCYIGPGALFLHDKAKKVGFWDCKIKMAPDREFIIRLLSEGKIHFHQKVLALYRQHPDSGVVKNVNEEAMGEYLYVADKLYALNLLDEREYKLCKAYSYLTITRACLINGDVRSAIKNIKLSRKESTEAFTVQVILRLIGSYMKNYVLKV